MMRKFLTVENRLNDDLQEEALAELLPAVAAKLAARQSW